MKTNTTILVNQFYGATTITLNLDKVDQSDYRKITIHSEKISCQS